MTESAAAASSGEAFVKGKTRDVGTARLEIRRFVPNHETLGILVDYLGQSEPFRNIPTGDFVRALKHQIAEGHHVCAFRGDRLVGYCGWLETTIAIGETWVARKGELKSVRSPSPEASALTIVRSEDPAALPLMIRAIRRIGKGRRIFFRREYGERGEKRQSVLNV